MVQLTNQSVLIIDELPMISYGVKLVNKKMLIKNHDIKSIIKLNQSIKTCCHHKCVKCFNSSRSHELILSYDNMNKQTRDSLM